MSIQTSMLAVLVITFVIVNFTHIVRLQGSCSLYNQGTADILQLLTRATMMQRQTSVGRLGIPKILHHIFLDGEAAFWRNATDGDDFSPNYYAHKRKEGERRAAFKHEWKTSCQSAHPDWLYHFWDMDKALIFIKDHYPWFLPTFEGYPDVVAKGDALRPLLLHAMGGLYLDLDVECFRPADPFLEGHDLVLQAEEDNEQALINAVMASTPQHPLWDQVIQQMMERAHTVDGINSIFSATGPRLLSEVYANFTAAQGVLKQGPEVEKKAQGGSSLRQRAQSLKSVSWQQVQYSQRLTPRVYKLKEFYVPCNWLSQEDCETINAATEKPAELAGFHHWAGSWKVW